MREAKAALRAKIRAELASFDGRYISESDVGIIDNVLNLPEYAGAGAVFAYSSTGRECSTSRLLRSSLDAGRAVALPRALGGGKMLFVQYTGELRPGRYDIPEPPDEAARMEPGAGDIVIVPALCCDMEGYRLGRGGGYYDRMLPGCPASSVCLCRERLLQKNLPREWNDFPVDIVVTEARVLRLRGPK